MDRAAIPIKERLKSTPGEDSANTKKAAIPIKERLKYKLTKEVFKMLVKQQYL